MSHGLAEAGRLMTLFGGMDPTQRESIKAAFQAHPGLSPVRILLATDAASEGIDLQNHCHQIIHFEVPWNPNRLEQRNGRVDRHGQQVGEEGMTTSLRQSTAQRELQHYLRTGEHDDPLFGAWPGKNAFESSTNGTNALIEALLKEVEARLVGLDVPEIELPPDLVAFTRARVEPMVRGLFPDNEQDVVLGVLERSIVFVTPANYREVLTSVELDTAWDVANFFLASVGGGLLGKEPVSIVGLNQSTTSYVSTVYFQDDDPFADYIVHECAHTFHNAKRRTVGLPFAKTREWMLEIDFARREMFAYCCEAFSRSVARATSVKGRLALVDERATQPRVTDRTVSFDEYLDILRDAARARNGWKRILERCSPPSRRRGRPLSP